jgi:hypothetical protein
VARRQDFSRAVFLRSVRGEDLTARHFGCSRNNPLVGLLLQ